MREIEYDNVKLVRKVVQMELEIKKSKAHKKKMRKNHREEPKNRYRKEIMFVFVVAACIVMYAFVALIIGVV